MYSSEDLDIFDKSILNKQMKILTSQYIGTCKSAYTKGYALI